MLADTRRHLHRAVAGARGTRRDRDNEKLRAMRPLFGGDDDDDRSILDALLAASRGLAVPEIGISEDVSRFRGRP
jgi:hypothetical protein